MSDKEATWLVGKVLIAMPGMANPRFVQSVIFLNDHTEKGAMGLVVNRRARDVTLRDVLDQISDNSAGSVPKMPVHFGGPVETGRGFVLHSDDYQSVIETQSLPAGFALTATQDVLEDIAAGKGPKRAMLMLGYSGWGPGQLEREIAENGWLTVDATQELVFGTADNQKWSSALAALGIDPLALSAASGRA